MKKQRIHFRLIALLLVGLLALTALYGAYSTITYGNRWFSNTNNTRVREGKQSVVMGDVFDRNGVTLATTRDGARVYQQDADSRRAVVHLLGDNQGRVSNGVESFQASYLLGFQTSLPERVAQLLSGDTRRGDDVTLTVDSALCTRVVRAFEQGAATRGKSGAAVVMNYKTGEILALVSLPVFDPTRITRDVLEDPLQPFWNRATQSTLPPGSAFKVVTLAAALKHLPDVERRTFTCLGGLRVLDGSGEAFGSLVTDANRARHGELSLRRAFAVSCNVTFASLALQMGDDNLRAMAEGFGLNDNFLFRDIVVENSSYPTTGRTNFEVAWSGDGQSRVLMTPLHLCMTAAAVANGGVMMEPRLLKAAVSPSGVTRLRFTEKVYRRVLDKDTADTVRDCMRAVVTSGTGTNAAVPGMRIAGKTGSAEGAMNGVPATHAWFMGFCEDDAFPYAVCVLVEGGGSGGSVAAPIAKAVFQYLKEAGEAE